MADGVLVAFVALAMAVGIVGTVLPFVPGLGLVWLAALVYGIGAGFGATGWVAFALITTLAIAGAIAGIAVPRRAAVSAGAGRSLWLGAAMGVAGFFLIPVVGLPLGGVAGVYLGERLRTRDRALAWRATTATLKGVGLAAVIQLVAGLAMTVAWVGWVLLD